MLQRVDEYYFYLNIEICEEDDQRNHIRNLEIQPPLRKCTWPNNTTAGLEDCQDKLSLGREKKKEKWSTLMQGGKKPLVTKISLVISKLSQKYVILCTSQVYLLCLINSVNLS